MPRAPFDDPALRAMNAFGASAAEGDLVPSMAHEMAVFPAVRGAIMDVVTNYYNSNLSAKAAAARLASEVEAAK
jgi:glucose/mannose transport system substrate-binding protein